MDKPFPAYKGSEPFVFVCYAHDDAHVVYEDMRWLHECGVRLWYDEGIAAGAVWRAEITRALRAASYVLFFISRASLSSTHCSREIDYALDKGIRVLPVFLEDVGLPDGLDLALNRIQALHRKEPRYQEHLLAALGESAEPSAARRRSYPWWRLGVGLTVAGAAAALWF